MVRSTLKLFILLSALSFSASKLTMAQSPNDCVLPAVAVAPTDQTKTFIRKGNGEWAAPRIGGGSHKGVDLIVNASHAENLPYAVQPVATGKVAYSRLNGSQSTGYGNLIVIDHGRGCYSLYAHLANLPFTPIATGGNLLVKVGDSVGPGKVIGYFVDIKADVDSSGNAQTTAPEARHQIHFALIKAPSGRTSITSLGAILGNDGVIFDPTQFLLSKGYKYF